MSGDAERSLNGGPLPAGIDLINRGAVMQPRVIKSRFCNHLH